MKKNISHNEELVKNLHIVIPAKAGSQEKNIKITGCRITRHTSGKESGMTKILDPRWSKIPHMRGRG
ncbi:hypothetical protein ASZ90_007951 [hydrocarbon metagenome]|uniref:Uncharacterized protein n=1 Tax=hydrocarbon metagenome TaxID=938273 RepID=A0A0W8FMZ9_9ZZZZ